MKNLRINFVITSNSVNEAPYNNVFDSLLVENRNSKVAYEIAVLTDFCRKMEVV
jgi:hypothetical protein